MPHDEDLVNDRWTDVWGRLWTRRWSTRVQRKPGLSCIQMADYVKMNETGARIDTNILVD